MGDLTAHHGWTLHWSPPQPEDSAPRYALSICYFADGARRMSTENLRRVPHDEDEWSYDSGCERLHRTRGAASGDTDRVGIEDSRGVFCIMYVRELIVNRIDVS